MKIVDDKLKRLFGIMMSTS